MKALFAIAGLLLVFAFFAGCTQPQVQPTPTPQGGTGTTLTDQQQNQAVDEFNNGLVDANQEIDIGEMA